MPSKVPTCINHTSLHSTHALARPPTHKLACSRATNVAVARLLRDHRERVRHARHAAARIHIGGAERRQALLGVVWLDERRGDGDTLWGWERWLAQWVENVRVLEVSL